MLSAVFRTDASSVIGVGHLMRCLTLAEHLKQKTYQIHFICRGLSPAQEQLIRKKEYGLHCLPLADTGHLDPANHNTWLALDWFDDLSQTLGVLRRLPRPTLFVVDHYGINHKWESGLTDCVDSLFVIDDLANRKHNCDFLLDQNFYFDQSARYENLIDENTHCFFGPRYALIRREILLERIAMFNDKVERINVCFGGLGNEICALETVDLLKPLLSKYEIECDVILGHKQKELESASPFNFYQSPAQFPKLLARADICIGASGSMTWERAYLGLPTIAFSVARNQVHLAQDAAKAGLHLYLGSFDRFEKNILIATLELLIENKYLRYHLSHRGSGLVDGLGPERIGKILSQRMVNL